MMASLATGWRGAGQMRAAQQKEGDGLLARTSARGINVVDWEATTPGLREELLRAAVDWGNFPELTIWTATVPLDTLAAPGQAEGVSQSPPRKSLIYWWRREDSNLRHGAYETPALPPELRRLGRNFS
jgi:hypothetical protein